MKIAITGAKGFIGKNLVTAIKASKSEDEVITVERNYTASHREDDPYFPLTHGPADFIISEFMYQLEHGLECDRIVHLGAISSTQEDRPGVVFTNNLICSMDLYEIARQRQIPFIYASSAAVYGHGGTHGFSDLPYCNKELKPLNLYGYSKLWFDNWLWDTYKHRNAVGLRLFNVYGPGESHKGDMGSIVSRAYHQIKETGKVQLFKDPRDSSILPMGRDMIFIADVIHVIAHFIHNPHRTGIFNVGTGTATTWENAVQLVFKALKVPTKIEYIEFPEEMKKNYQWYTCACISQLYREARYPYILTDIASGASCTIYALEGALKK